MKSDRREFMKLAGGLSLAQLAGMAGLASIPAAMPARVAMAAMADGDESIMTPTALKYSPEGTVEDAYPTNLPGVLPREKVQVWRYLLRRNGLDVGVRKGRFALRNISEHRFIDCRVQFRCRVVREHLFAQCISALVGILGAL